MKEDLMIQRYDYQNGATEVAIYRHNGSLVEATSEVRYLGKAMWLDNKTSHPVPRISEWRKSSKSALFER